MASDLEPVLAPSVVKYAKLAFEDRHNDSSATTKQSGFDTFLKELASVESSTSVPGQADLSHPISQYFVSSSHNTYLTGNQLWSKASTDTYKNTLKRGCRCIEIDVWDGDSPSNTSSSDEGVGGQREESDIKKLGGLLKKGLGRFRSNSSSRDGAQAKEAEVAVDSPAGESTHMPTPWRTTSDRAEPRVLHGYTATKEVSFRKVCEVIRDYAFRTTDLPLIVSLEIHTGHEQQEIMVEIINDYWKQYLVPIPIDAPEDIALPPLESLRKRILIKIKYSSPKKAAKEEKHPTKSASKEDSSEDEAQVDPAKKGKIVEALGRLGLYTRSCHFKDFSQPEAQIPTHVFSLSEGKVIDMQEQHPDELFKHNVSYLMRAYPKGTRVRSTNLDPLPFWRVGIQIVALNWQQVNAAMMLNEAMFAGTGGWVLKPDGYRKVGESVGDVKRVNVNLTVKILAAQGIGKEGKTPNTYVKCQLHVDSAAEKQGSIPEGGQSKGGEWKRRSSIRHSRDPDWSAETMEFKGVERVVPELSFVRYVSFRFLPGCHSTRIGEDRTEIEHWRAI